MAGQARMGKGNGVRKKRKTNRPSSGKVKRGTGRREEKGKKEKRKRQGVEGSKAQAATRPRDSRPAQSRENVQLKREEVATKAKKIWERLRIKKNANGGSDEKRHELVAQLLELFKGRMGEMAVRHDTSRIIQSILAFGSEEQRQVVKDELLPAFVRLAEDKYARFLAMKLARGLTKTEREPFFHGLRGSIMTLVRSAHGADVLDFVYQTVANSKQKLDMMIELLHGKEYALLSSLRMKKTKVASFDDALQAAGDTFRPALLSSASEVVKSFAGKEASMRLALTHRVCREYLEKVENTAEKQEIAQLFAPSALSFVHTRDGIVFICCCIDILGSEKMRLEVLDQLEDNVMKVASDEYGHMLLLCLLGFTRDSAKLWETMFSPCMGSDDDLASVLCHRYARQVFLHVLAPFSSRYFHPDSYKFLPNYGAKDPIPGRDDLCERLLPPLADCISECGAKLLCNAEGASAVNEFVLVATEKTSHLAAKVLRAIVVCLRQRENGKDDADNAEEHPLESAVGLRRVIWLIGITHKALPKGECLGSFIAQDADTCSSLARSEAGCKVLNAVASSEESLRQMVSRTLEGCEEVVDKDLVKHVPSRRTNKRRKTRSTQ